MAVRDRTKDALWSSAGISQAQRPANQVCFARGWDTTGRPVASWGWRSDASEFHSNEPSAFWLGGDPATIRERDPGIIGIIGFRLAGQRITMGENEPNNVALIRTPTFVDYPAIATIGATGDYSAAPPTWLGPVLERLDSILALPEDWDGRNARRPNSWHAVEAFGFLQRVMRTGTALPSIVPLVDGGVQVEWHQGGLDVEATFTAGPDRGLYFADLSTGEEFEGPVDVGIGQLRGLMTRLEEASTATTVDAAH